MLKFKQFLNEVKLTKHEKELYADLHPIAVATKKTAKDAHNVTIKHILSLRKPKKMEESQQLDKLEEENLDEMSGANWKTRDLLHHIKKHGWNYSRSNGQHDIYTHPKSQQHLSIPRHKQLKAPLVLDILKKSVVAESTMEEAMAPMIHKYHVMTSNMNTRQWEVVKTHDSREKAEKHVKELGRMGIHAKIEKSSKLAEEMISESKIGNLVKHLEGSHVMGDPFSYHDAKAALSGARKKDVHAVKHALKNYRVTVSQDEKGIRVHHPERGDHYLEEETIQERTLSAAETDKKEEIVKSMKKKGDFSKYGDRAKEVMYATATKAAKRIAEGFKVGDKVHLGFGKKGGAGHTGTLTQLTDTEAHVNIGKDKFGDRIVKGPVKNLSEKHWIQKAIKHKGALTAQAHKAGESPMEFAHEHEHDSGKTGARSRLALTLKGLHKEEYNYPDPHPEHHKKKRDHRPSIWERIKKSAHDKKKQLKEVTDEHEQIEEGRRAMPLKGHDYHYKSDAELHYIKKDAYEAAQNMRGHDAKAEGKYMDQVSDAGTVLNYRKNGGKQLERPKTHMNEETGKCPDCGGHIAPGQQRQCVPCAMKPKKQVKENHMKSFKTFLLAEETHHFHGVAQTYDKKTEKWHRDEKKYKISASSRKAAMNKALKQLQADFPNHHEHEVTHADSMNEQITNQRDLRKHFWDNHPHLDRKKIKDYEGHGKMHKTDARSAFADHVDALHRSGHISDKLAHSATLSEEEEAEQLQELSKSTLKSYVKKAADNMFSRGMDHEKNKNNPLEIKKRRSHVFRASQRSLGISKALAHLEEGKKEIKGDVFDHHKTNIAKKTLRYSDAGARIMGGMTKDEARVHLKKMGWTDERIKKHEDS